MIVKSRTRSRGLLGIARAKSMRWRLPQYMWFIRRVIWSMICAPVFTIIGNAPPVAGFAVRSIVMLVDARGDLCAGTPHGKN
jgi:hypothetical protein